MYDKLTELFRPIYTFIMAVGIAQSLACFAVAAAAAYFLGCFNGAVIVSKYILHDDVRTHGSGNAGLTNFYRTFGGPLTLVVILCDVIKAVLAVWIGVLAIYFSMGCLPQHVIYGKYWAGLWCLLGHMFPCMFHFKGGKGILSGGTIAIMIDWRVALVVWGGFIVLTVLTKYVSLGSCWAGATFPIATFMFHPGTPAAEPVIVALSIVIGGLILYMHRGNIHRLITGTENKFHLKKKT